MTKLLILDKDGTLITTKSGKTFVQHPQDQKLLPNVAETLQRYAADGWTMAIASNQGGIEAGYKTLDEAIAEMDYCMDLIPEISYSLFCPELTFGETCWQLKPNGAKMLWRDQLLIDKPNHLACSPPTPRSLGCRKPNPGMIRIAQTIFDSMDNCLFVGDRLEDQQAAAAAGVEFQWAKDFFGGSS